MLKNKKQKLLQNSVLQQPQEKVFSLPHVHHTYLFLRRGYACFFKVEFEVIFAQFGAYLFGGKFAGFFALFNGERGGDTGDFTGHGGAGDNAVGFPGVAGGADAAAGGENAEDILRDQTAVRRFIDIARIAPVAIHTDR